MADRIQLRGDTAAAWALANPVLAQREFALETDTNKTKIGDGVTAWNALPYASITGPTVIGEYVDANPPSPIVGQQWIRLSTLAPAHSPTHLAPLGLIGNLPTPRRKGELKTQTSIGVI